MTDIKVIGILGAGRVGTALARRALAAGYEVRIASARAPSEIALMMDFVAPGAVPATTEQVIAESDMVLLALPLSKYRSLRPEAFAGKIAVDAMNYWPQTDGVLPEFEGAPVSSEVVADHLAGARLLRAFNHLGYHELDAEARPAGDPGRRALAIAGDDAAARADLAVVIDRMGFDPVDAGPLAQARAFAIGTPLFGAPLGRVEMQEALAGQQAA
ncbi:NAD(P)-binding domain-containing protein [Paracoccus sp. S1E-3]|uniref:NADPH-dependent F420 reductase n=1 Tax=Paracoccus sp. S1E-3 TaxID=2756130 RepID=UPI0015EE9735|nr:NAD(P)-binding domain-containing protein [Paracoccus sp. S1E-3]MBA4492390.1 NAD(P)-binding domain-containing protein [Paracoccus sp. S1E-3]